MKAKNSLILMIVTLFIQNTMIAQDWANLEKFKNQNDVLLQNPDDADRIVFLGNSITEGWLNSPSNFFDNPHFINRGIGGQTTPQMLLRFRQDVINLNPKAVVILAGINDIASNTGPMTPQMTIDNLISMMELAKTNKIKVFFCSILPANKFTWRPEIEPALEVQEINEAIKALADGREVIYVDFYSKMVNDEMGLKKELGADGVHPNAQGYAIMEPIITKALNEYL